MANCVGSYAARAVKGQCYLFHASYKGEEATIELSRNGDVFQSAGPHNKRSKAAGWGAKTLRRWSKDFPKVDRAPGPDDVGENISFADDAAAREAAAMEAAFRADPDDLPAHFPARGGGAYDFEDIPF